MKRVRSVGGALAAAAMAVSGLGIVSVVSQSATVSAAITPTPSASCQMGYGLKHVIEITFDNVHFTRDNPNVPSDVEQLPALKNFIESNGTMLSNNHTPLIAHTANDSVTNYTGLYGDRHGLGITNSYDTYNTAGTAVTNKSAFAYWTANYGLNGGLDPFPNMPYSATVPAAGAAPASPPAPWVPFTRAGCDFGAVSTANMVLENTNPDLQNVFGAGSAEAKQLSADTNSFKDQESNDYVGLAVHSAQNDSFCSTAKATKFGDTTPSNTAANDVLPNEPTPYVGYQAVFGSKYLSPQLAQAATAAGKRTVTGNTYPVTDASGNLTDLNGTTMVGPFTHTPGFPGFGQITASQSLAYVAAMQESGVPVTYAYISDLHQQFNAQTNCGSPAGALGPGDTCYEDSASAYNTAFATFFQRLADDGITPANTEFVFTADEGDHFAGANVGRAVTPTCTGTPGVAKDTATGETPYLCTYAPGQLGEVATSIHSLLKFQTGNTTGFYSQPQGEAIYAFPMDAPGTTPRQLERDVASLTMVNPYDGSNPEPVTKWMVDATGERLLHFVNADPNRTPSFTVWPNPDVFFSQGTSDSCAPGTTAATAAAGCNGLNPSFSWNHGYYAPEVDTTWLGLVGPGVAHKGLDGPAADDGPNSAGSAANGIKTVPEASRHGTWADHTDIRPTILALAGLKDDYVGDGRVLVEDLTIEPGATGQDGYLPLARCYKQLDASVGRFGTDVIVAETAALKTGSAGSDTQYQVFSSHLQALGAAHDKLASKIKQALFDAEFNGKQIGEADRTGECNDLLEAADSMARRSE